MAKKTKSVKLGPQAAPPPTYDVPKCPYCGEMLFVIGYESICISDMCDPRGYTRILLRAYIHPSLREVPGRREAEAEAAKPPAKLRRVK
jgi:hypothetical protein